MQINPYKWYQQALRTKGLKWVVIILTIIYILSPVDLIPDFIPGVGVIDDGIILVVLVSELVRMGRERIASRNDDKKNLK